jgi:hypothetical protein
MADRRSACRRLTFDDVENSGRARAGTGDGHVNILQEEMRSDMEVAIQRWNFDFENEVPLEGRWQWEKVPSSELPSEEGQAGAQTEGETEASECDADKPQG